MSAGCRAAAHGNPVARDECRLHTGRVSLDSDAGRRADYEAKSAALTGRSMQQIRYWDIHNYSSEPRDWDYGDAHHAVMGVELLTDRGSSCVLWTGTFFCYGVEVFHTPMAGQLVLGEDGPECWDAGSSDRWRQRLRSPVVGVQTYWEHVRVGPAYVRGTQVSGPHEVDVPVALRLDFSAGPAWMVAGMPMAPGMRDVVVGGDEIIVAFTADRMRQIGFPDSAFLDTRS